MPAFICEKKAKLDAAVPVNKRFLPCYTLHGNHRELFLIWANPATRRVIQICAIMSGLSAIGFLYLAKVVFPI